MEIEVVPIARLIPAFLPVAAVVGVMWLWKMDVRKSLHAVARMLLQLTLVGYVLVYIFNTESALLVSGVLLVMVIAASSIALNTVPIPMRTLWPASLVAVLLGGGTTLAIVTQGVLRLEPWYQPNYIIPLAGMIFASSMTNISLALERTKAELDNGKAFADARRIAFRASMIPVINSFFAVGVISLPGMMTGQILSGVSPLIAVRYQIVVMCMIFGAAGLSTACFLSIISKSEKAAKQLY